MRKTDKAAVVESVLAALVAGNAREAENIAKHDYPWGPVEVPVRKMTQKRALSVFMRDGFIDRYSGSRLIFPGTLLLLRRVLPDSFPAHENWQVSKTHDVYFELWPVVDHVIPVARGGEDNESNFATTSNLNNDVKSMWTLEQLQWELHPPGKIGEWDGLMTWFLEYAGCNTEVLEDRTISGWYKTAANATQSMTED
jgi:hypothetical protein